MGRDPLIGDSMHGPRIIKCQVIRSVTSGRNWSTMTTSDTTGQLQLPLSLIFLCWPLWWPHIEHMTSDTKCWPLWLSLGHLTDHDYILMTIFTWPVATLESWPLTTYWPLYITLWTSGQGQCSQRGKLQYHCQSGQCNQWSRAKSHKVHAEVAKGGQWKFTTPSTWHNALTIKYHLIMGLLTTDH
jgi:hypothetical protein